MNHFRNTGKFLVVFLFIIALTLSTVAWSTSEAGNMIVRGYFTANGTAGANITNGDLTVGDDTFIGNDLSVERNASASWFNGRFNWTSLTRFITFDGANLDFDSAEFNETYDGRFYNQSDADDTFVDVAGDTMTGSLNMSGNNVTNVNTLIGDGDVITIGDTGVDSHSLTANDDLFVSGKLEVDAQSYFDGTSLFYSNMRVMDNVNFHLGTGDDVSFGWRTDQTPDTALIGLSSESRGIILTESDDVTTDFEQPLKDNPTVFVQSANESDTDEFLSLEHDQTDSRVTSGQGDIRLSSAESVNVDGDFKMGDENNYKLFELYANGTHIVMDSPYSLPFYFDNSGVIVQNITTNQFIEIQANTSAVTCTAGTIYYDGTDNVHKACNGSAAWNDMY